MKREFIPGVYEHFKGNMYYGIAKTYIVDHVFDSSIFKEIEAVHTENGKIVKVYVLYDGIFCTVEGEEFIFYKALYDDGKYYIRPVDMFLSEVDKTKYPEIEQAYRFEYIN